MPGACPTPRTWGTRRSSSSKKRSAPPPYTDILRYPVAFSSNPDWDDYNTAADHDNWSSYPACLFVPEYTLTKQVRSMAAISDTFKLIYPQLQEVDTRRNVPRLDVRALHA